MQKIIISVLLTLFLGSASATEFEAKTATDRLGRSYTYYTNDPVGMHLYQLDNGLKIYLSVNTDAPRVQSFIAVKAGSTYDPKETTGLAHYLEHMMFKGTSRIGTLDWERERPLLDTISALYERHKATADTAEKNRLYLAIDSVSQLASKLAISNEYDYMARSLGADGTNAYTWLEETVYLNDVPTNAVRNYLILENERFNELTLRLFHTELEAVYEEFNMSQDNDSRKAFRTLMEGLFPNHPYGTQTTIGVAEHLKNPSMVNIHKYWEKYYVPNNMAICMAGDLDPAQTAFWIDSLWSSKPRKDVEPLILPVEKPLNGPIKTEVFGPNPESMVMAYRTNGIQSEDELYVTMIDYLLSAGGKAGLIDLNLVKAQKVLAAGCGPYFMREYGMHMLFGVPRQGQSLEEVQKLLLAQIEKIKKGEFEEWQLQAIVNDMKLQRIRAQESKGIADEFVSAFTNGYDWSHYLSMHERLEKLTKAQIMAYAQKLYTPENLVIVYKRVGEDSSIVKVAKPPITPIDINRKDQSAFLQQFMKEPKDTIKPVFVNYDSVLVRKPMQDGVTFNYIHNNTNELFSLYYIVEIGSNHNKLFSLAVSYLEYLGTKKYSPDQLSNELFRYGLDYGVSAGDDRSYIYVSGLDQSFDKGVEMLEHILYNAKADKRAYQDFVDGIMKQRQDQKLDKDAIKAHMVNYGKYGKNSPMHDFLTEEELRKIDPAELTKLVKTLCSYPHDVVYYGSRSEDEAMQIIAKHRQSKKILPLPEPKTFVPLETTANTVYFVNYDMVQADIILLNRGDKFDRSLIAPAAMYSEYFGSGLSSIVFQEIRESKALAYSAYSAFRMPSNLTDYSFCVAAVNTNATKLEDATRAMEKLMSVMPKETELFNGSKQSIIEQMSTDRTIKSGIYFSYLRNKDRGIDYDIRRDVYNEIDAMTPDKLEEFFNAHVAGRPFTYLVMGNRKDIDMELLKRLGPVTELTLEDLFGY